MRKALRMLMCRRRIIAVVSLSQLCRRVSQFAFFSDFPRHDDIESESRRQADIRQKVGLSVDRRSYLSNVEQNPYERLAKLGVPSSERVLTKS
jgi:hypothetical protein